MLEVTIPNLEFPVHFLEAINILRQSSFWVSYRHAKKPSKIIASNFTNSALILQSLNVKYLQKRLYSAVESVKSRFNFSNLQEKRKLVP